MAFDY